MKNIFKLGLILLLAATTSHAQTSGSVSATITGQTVAGNFAFIRGSYATTTWTYTVTDTVTTGTNRGGGTIDGTKLNYSWSGGSGVLDNAANPAPNSATNNQPIPPNVTVSWTFTPHSGGTNGSAVTGTFVVPAAPSQRVQGVDKIQNHSDFPMTAVYKEGTKTIATVTVPPHTDYPMTVDVYDGGNVTVTYTVNDAVLSGGDWISSPGSTIPLGSGVMTNASMTAVNGISTDSPVVFNSIGLQNDATIPARYQPGVGIGSGIASAVPIFTATQTALTPALTGGMFASGINQQTSQIVSAIWASGIANKSSSSGGSGGDASAANQVTGNAKLDSLIAATTSSDTYTAYNSTYTGTITPTASAVMADMSKLPTGPTITNISTTTHTISVDIPFYDGAHGSTPRFTKTVSVDLSNWSTSVTVFRTLMIAVLYLTFFFLTVRTIRRAVTD